MTPEGTNMLKKHEGLQLLPYTDTTGHLSIGYGRNLTDRGISSDEADRMLDHDIGSAWLDAVREFPWFAPLDHVRQDVVINLIFNMGLGTLRQFRLMLRALEHHEWQAAAYELFNSRWCHQVGKERCQDLTHALEYGRWD